MLAHAFLAVTTARERTTHNNHATPTANDQLIPLTCNEIRHLRAAITRPVHEPQHTCRWSRFRRRHQHRARLCHYRRRQDHDLRL
jgi:hypothetical protein